MQNARRAFAIYRRIVFAAAVIMAAAFIGTSHHALPIGDALPFLILAVVMELSPVVLRDAYSEVSVAFPVLWATVLLFGHATAALVSFWAVLIAYLIAFPCGVLAARWGALAVPSGSPDRSRKRRFLLPIATKLAGNWIGRQDYPPKYALELIVFNACTVSIAFGMAGLAYRAAGGVRLVENAVSWSSLPGLLAPLVIGVAVYFTTDTVLFSANGAVLRVTQQGFNWRGFYLNLRMIALGYIPPTAWNHSFMMPFGVLLAVLYLRYGVESFVAILVPFFAVRHMLWLTTEQFRTYRDTITTLGTLMQHYHPYTRGHLRRVADLSERLARELGRPPRTVMLMADAGMLHDVGKVGVSEEILDKTGKLSDEEWDVIRSHPVKGAEILSHMPYLNQIVDWVKYHHKWANGAGYPEDGNGNGGIPIEAAIIAVADAFDAMTDDREMTLDWKCDTCGYAPPDGERPDECPQCHAPKARVYRKPLSLDQAVDQLRRGSGTQFRPEVVQAFLTMIDRDGVRLNA